MGKSNYDITRMMREDLMAAYREVVQSCWTQKEAWEKTAKHPAPRYYLTPKQAWDEMRRMVKGDFSRVDSLPTDVKRKYYSLFSKLEQLTQKREFIGKSLFYICQHLVVQPAPEFFIKPQTVRQIFYYYKKHGSNYRYKDIHPEYFQKSEKSED